MKFLRFRNVIDRYGGNSGGCGAMTWRVHAQSTQTGRETMPPIGHMMPDRSQAMPDHQHMHGVAGPDGNPSMSEKSDDPREFVSLPAPMQEHMLADMRDHLTTLNTVIGDIANANFDAASKLLEERLGMSSLSLHHAAEIAPYFPQPMQDAGTSMHHAASRLAIVLQDASVAQTFDSMREANTALHEVTSACVSCHTGYRLR
jgi:hypothetical protein